SVTNSSATRSISAAISTAQKRTSPPVAIRYAMPPDDNISRVSGFSAAFSLSSMLNMAHLALVSPVTGVVQYLGVLFTEPVTEFGLGFLKGAPGGLQPQGVVGTRPILLPVEYEVVGLYVCRHGALA